MLLKVIMKNLSLRNNSAEKLKIAVLGAGALGSFYGAKLARAGHSVIFYSRSYRKKYGNILKVKSIWGSFSQKCRFISDISEGEPCDLVLVCVKGLSDVDYKSFISPFISRQKNSAELSSLKRPVIAIMQNGINQEEKIAKMFPRAVICGMLAFTCINRIHPMSVNHLDYGLIKIAPLEKKEIHYADKLTAIFTDAGIKTVTEKNLRATRWEKLLWNIPYNTLSVLLGKANTGQIMHNQFAEQIVIKLMTETRLIAAADGIKLSLIKQNEMLARTRKMKPYKTSMLLDFEKKLPLESDLILGEPLKIARNKKVHVPVLEQMYNALKFMERYES